MVYKRLPSITTHAQDYIDAFGSLELSASQCFNIGAGNWMHEAWTNIDLPAQTQSFAKIQAPFISHNLALEPELPIKKGSASLLYTSHVIEHLPQNIVQEFFISAYHALREGGIFRVITGPNADTDWDALIRNDVKWWHFYHDDDAFQHQSLGAVDYWLYHIATPRSPLSSTNCLRKYSSVETGQLVNEFRNTPERLWNLLCDDLSFEISSPGDHISWWNQRKVIDYLKHAGFSRVYASAYCQSQSHLLRDSRLFDITYPQISLYVECVK